LGFGHEYHVESGQQKHHVGAMAFDRERGLLYVFEPLADEDKSLVHVWRVGGRRLPCGIWPGRVK